MSGWVAVRATWLEVMARWHGWRFDRAWNAKNRHLERLHKCRVRADGLAQCQAQYWPTRAARPWRCTKRADHDDRHGYAGVFW